MTKKTLLSFFTVLCFCQLMGQQRMEKATYYGHLYLESLINGRTARLAFDTGSPYVCMDSIYLADSGFSYKNVMTADMGGSGNNVEKVRIIVDELTYTLVGKEYRSKISPIIHLKPILGDYADGILGMSELGGKIIAINYIDPKLGFWDKLETADTMGYTRIPIRYQETRIFIPMKVVVRDGITIEGEVLMDLGSGHSLSLTSLVAEQYGLKNIAPLMPFSMVHGGIGGEASSCDFRAKSVTIGPFTLNDVVMDFSNNTVGAFASKAYFGVLGNDILERFDIIVDLIGNQLYLKPNADFGKPFESPVLGFSYTDRNQTLGCWVVNGIYKDSNADKAGLQPEDHITAVNGRSVKEIGVPEQRDYFKGMSQVALTVQRGDTLREIVFEIDVPKI